MKYTLQVVRISPSGKLLATGGDDAHLRVWAFPDMAKVGELVISSFVL